jgi:hypothetical protein
MALLLILISCHAHIYLVLSIFNSRPIYLLACRRISAFSVILLTFSQQIHDHQSSNSKTKVVRAICTCFLPLVSIILSCRRHTACGVGMPTFLQGRVMSFFQGVTISLLKETILAGTETAI